MGKKYIVELPKTDSEFDFASIRPYAEPDLEQVRIEAYKDGYDAGFGRKIDASYTEGLFDAWEAARKIYLPTEYGGIPADVLRQIFNNKSASGIFKKVSASEAVEKIRQYEQEKDRQARIEYNFDEIKDVLETTAKECNVSLDEIAEVLQKMKEANNG